MLPVAALPADSLVLLLDDPTSLARAEALLPCEEDDDNGVLAVGIDAEWGPTEESEEEEGERRGRGRGRGKADAATLLQVALKLRRPIPSSPPRSPPSPSTTAKTTTTTLVLIFDLVTLDHDAAAPLLKKLLAEESLPGAVKLGWGLRGDLAALVAAGEKRKAAALSAAARVARPAVDLRGAVLSLLQRERRKSRHGGDFCTHHGLGLAAAVASFLGRNLDKTHQTSSWGRRPLSEGQIEYAALDAAILLDVVSDFFGVLNVFFFYSEGEGETET